MSDPLKPEAASPRSSPAHHRDDGAPPHPATFSVRELSEVGRQPDAPAKVLAGVAWQE